MAPNRVTIRFEDPDAWENNRETVDGILQKDTGTSDYPATKSLPPIIFGPEISDEAVEELRKLSGVVVNVQDED